MTPATRPISLSAASTAFLIIDMQNDFLDPTGYFARSGRRIHNLRRSIEPVRLLRRSLPKGVKTIFTTQIYEPDGADDLKNAHAILPAALTRAADDTPVRRGSWGAEVIQELAPDHGDHLIAKRRFDAFYQTDLEMLLRCWKVKTVICAGVVADVCVESTARSAYIRDFDVILAEECVGAWQARTLRRTVDVVNNHLGIALSNREIVDAFGGARRR